MELLKSGFFADSDDLDHIVSNMDIVTSWLNEMDRIESAGNLTDNDLEVVQRCNGTMKSLVHLQKAAHCFSYIFEDAGKNVADFRLLIEQELPQKDHSKLQKAVVVPTTTLNLLCLNASIVFKEIKTQCSSIILASGTLSPLSTFANELNIEFSNQIEGLSSVDVNRQLYATVVPSYHNVTLLGDFQNRSNPIYIVRQ